MAGTGLGAARRGIGEVAVILRRVSQARTDSRFPLSFSPHPAASGLSIMPNLNSGYFLAYYQPPEFLGSPRSRAPAA